MLAGDLVALRPPPDANHRMWSRGDQERAECGHQTTTSRIALAAQEPLSHVATRGWFVDDQNASSGGREGANCVRNLVAPRPPHLAFEGKEGEVGYGATRVAAKVVGMGPASGASWSRRSQSRASGEKGGRAGTNSRARLGCTRPGSLRTWLCSDHPLRLTPEGGLVATRTSSELAGRRPTGRGSWSQANHHTAYRAVATVGVVASDPGLARGWLPADQPAPATWSRQDSRP